MSVPIWAFAAACMAFVTAATCATCLWWDLDAAERRIANLKEGNRLRLDMERAATARAIEAERLRVQDRELYATFMTAQLGVVPSVGSPLGAGNRQWYRN